MGISVCEQNLDKVKAVLPRETLALFIGNVIAIPVALLLNTTIILNILLRRRLRSARNAITLNFCVVNLFLTIAGRLPFTLNLQLLSMAVCKMGQIIGQTAVALSLLASFFLNLDRYIAIFYPYKYPHFLKRWIITLLLVLTWFLPFAATLVALVPGVQFKLTYSIFSAVKIAILSCLVGMNLRVMYTLVKINKEIASTASRFVANMDRRTLIRGSKGLRFISVSLVALFVCYFPLSLINILRQDHIDASWMRINFLAVNLALLPDIVNPICLLSTSQEIRSSVLRLPWR